MTRRFALAFLLGALALGFAPGADAQASRSIEIIEVRGIVDGSVERAVLAAIEQAGPDTTDLIVLQIDSVGVVDARRTSRMVSGIQASPVPVATWVGPGGAKASNGAGLIALAGHVRAVSPGASLGPFVTLDLRSSAEDLRGASVSVPGAEEVVLDEELAWTQAEEAGLVQLVVPSLEELLMQSDGLEVTIGEEVRSLDIDIEEATIRFSKLDLFGRLMHAAAQPSLIYLLVLLGLVGVVFEVFHPSTGPAGVAGLAALSLGLYGIVTLGGSWLGFALIVAGVVAFCVDLRFASLGLYTAAGLGLLVAGSLLLFSGPWLRVSPWVLAFGIVSITLFLVGAMTRVLRDLRAIARGELEVTEAHPHHPSEEP